MRIVSRAEFLKLTKPTIFAKAKILESGQPDIDYCLNIFYPYDGYTNDFQVLPLDITYNIKADEPSELYDQYERLESGQSVELEYDSIVRDGCFEDDIKFAIFEEADLAVFKRLINSI